VISLGSAAHEGEWFRALLAWVGAHHARTYICIADTLQRHNRMARWGESATEAHVRSRRDGDAWFERNRRVLEALPIPYVLGRWSDWLADPRYPAARRAVRALHRDSPALRDEIDRDADRYLRSLARRGTPVPDRTSAVRRARAFLLEETAVFPLMMEDYPGDEVYPGSMLYSTRALLRMELPPELRLLADRRQTRIDYIELAGAERSDARSDGGTASPAQQDR
jgi:tRNA-dependent cyclodipeptide synthase